MKHLAILGNQCEMNIYSSLRTTEYYLWITSLFSPLRIGYFLGHGKVVPLLKHSPWIV
jgi:hypothetical protein